MKAFKHIASGLIIFLLLCSSQLLKAQDQEIGRLNNGVYELSNHSDAIQKAIEWTFKDGSKVIDLKIEELNQQIYLTANCLFQGKKRMLAVELDQKGNFFVLKEDGFIKTCSAFACENCKFFFEQHKIVACKCEESGTISNHCRFKTFPTTQLIQNYQRALRLKNSD